MADLSSPLLSSGVLMAAEWVTELVKHLSSHGDRMALMATCHKLAEALVNHWPGTIKLQFKHTDNSDFAGCGLALARGAACIGLACHVYDSAAGHRFIASLEQGQHPSVSKVFLKGSITLSSLFSDALRVACPALKELHLEGVRIASGEEPVAVPTRHTLQSLTLVNTHWEQPADPGQQLANLDCLSHLCLRGSTSSQVWELWSSITQALSSQLVTLFVQGLAYSPGWPALFPEGCVYSQLRSLRSNLTCLSAGNLQQLFAACPSLATCSISVIDITALAAAPPPPTQLHTLHAHKVLAGQEGALDAALMLHSRYAQGIQLVYDTANEQWPRLVFSQFIAISPALVAAALSLCVVSGDCLELHEMQLTRDNLLVAGQRLPATCTTVEFVSCSVVEDHVLDFDALLPHITTLGFRNSPPSDRYLAQLCVSVTRPLTLLLYVRDLRGPLVEYLQMVAKLTGLVTVQAV